MTGGDVELGPTRPGWQRALRLGWGMATVVAVAVVLADRWEEVGPFVADLRPGQAAAAAATVVVGVGLSAGVWRTLLAGLGSPLGLRAATRVFFLGQLGKYLPGSIWPVLAQMELGSDVAVPRRASAAAVILFLWVHLVTGLVVAAAGLPVAGVLHPASALLVPVCLVLLAPAPLGRLLAAGLRLTRREPLPALPNATTMAVAAAWALAMWVAYGLHLALLASAGGDPVGVVAATGAFAGAWAAGFLFLIAPAGAGIREALLTVVLAPPLTTGAALAVAVASRLLLTLADAGWALTGWLVGRARP